MAPAYFKHRLPGTRPNCEKPAVKVIIPSLCAGKSMARSPKSPHSLTHAQVWAALDRLAERAGLSASGLAKKSGLDPTTFNKSKRIAADGHERWPSTESIARALAATASSIEHFVRLIGDQRQPLRTIPLFGMAEATHGGAFDSHGFPTGHGQPQMALPSPDDEQAYALEISGDAMRPVYRDGDIIVVSPVTPIRRGDRVVVKTVAGNIVVGELKRRTARSLELQSLDSDRDDRTLAASDVAWVARILWATQ
jgi:phage repressor protein C with HTH and peptisase S24 domain